MATHCPEHHPGIHYLTATCQDCDWTWHGYGCRGTHRGRMTADAVGRNARRHARIHHHRVYVTRLITVIYAAVDTAA